MKYQNFESTDLIALKALPRSVLRYKEGGRIILFFVNSITITIRIKIRISDRVCWKDQ